MALNASLEDAWYCLFSSCPLHYPSDSQLNVLSPSIKENNHSLKVWFYPPPHTHISLTHSHSRTCTHIIHKHYSLICMQICWDKHCTPYSTVPLWLHSEHQFMHRFYKTQVTIIHVRWGQPSFWIYFQNNPFFPKKHLGSYQHTRTNKLSLFSINMPYISP